MLRRTGRPRALPGPISDGFSCRCGGKSPSGAAEMWRRQRYTQRQRRTWHVRSIFPWPSPPFARKLNGGGGGARGLTQRFEHGKAAVSSEIGCRRLVDRGRSRRSMRSASLSVYRTSRLERALPWRPESSDMCCRSRRSMCSSSKYASLWRRRMGTQGASCFRRTPLRQRVSREI